MGDGFYRSKNPTNSIKVLKENLQRKTQTTQRTKYEYTQKYEIVHAKKIQHIQHTASLLIYINMYVVY